MLIAPAAAIQYLSPNSPPLEGSPPSLQIVPLSNGVLIQNPPKSQSSPGQPNALDSNGAYFIPNTASDQAIANNGRPPNILTLAGGQVITVPSLSIPTTTLTLPNGQTATVPVSVPQTSITLTDGSVTNVPVAAVKTNAPPGQVLTLKDGSLTTINPDLARSHTITLPNGQTTVLPPTFPLTLFTLANGAVTSLHPPPTTVLTLRNAQATTVVNPSLISPQPASSTTITLPKGQTAVLPVGSIAGTTVPLTSVTLANGAVTTIPVLGSAPLLYKLLDLPTDDGDDEDESVLYIYPDPSHPGFSAYDADPTQP